jgi:acyl-CoA dehydrogenase
MEFDFSPEQNELKEQVRRYLNDHSDRKAVRAILDGPEPYDKALWKGLAELGYLGASIPEAYGGLGAGYLEACVIAEELGRALAPVPFSSSIAMAAECLMLAGSETQKQQYLRSLATGQSIATLALAESSGRVSTHSLKTVVTPKGAGFVLSGDKVAVADGDIADFVVVAALDPSSNKTSTGVHTNQASAPPMSLFLVDLGGAGVSPVGVSKQSIQTIDPTRSHAHLSFRDAPAERLGAPGAGWNVIDQVYDRAAVLVAFEQLGGADIMRWDASPLGDRLAPCRRLNICWPTCMCRPPWRVQIAITRLGLYRRLRLSFRLRQPAQESVQLRPFNIVRATIFRCMAAWGSPGSSTVTCTTVVPICWP